MIQGKEEEDITINLKDNDYVTTQAVIDPLTKNNILTYIVKENVPISFNLINTYMKPRQALLRIFYYRSIKNRNVIIRCMDTSYNGGKDISIVPSAAYNILKATNRLKGCLFIYQFDYKIVEGKSSEENKSLRFAFKIVSDREFKMYKDMEAFNKAKEYNDSIVKPVKPKKIQ